MSKRNKFPAGQGRHPRPAGRPAPPGRRPETARPGAGRPTEPEPASGGVYWIYGRHAVTAALTNPRRRIQRLLLADPASPDNREIAALSATRGRDAPGGRVPAEAVSQAELAELLPAGAVHQGVAARVTPLPPAHIEDICDRAAEAPRSAVLVLDQVTDPHNVGAILRSAAAFGAAAVVLTDRNAPPETGALAKAASGALEIVPLVRVTNLARALDSLKQAGFWCIGLAADAAQSLAGARLSGRVALVLGSEGEGLRRLTRERCDLLVRLPTGGPIGHLNVSNAAAVALYELSRDAGPS